MASARIDDLADWVAALGRASTLTELGALASCVVLAWACVALLRRALDANDPASIWFGRSIVDGVMFPFLLLSLAYGARVIVAG